MSNLQKTLEQLQPYVIGIRYVEGKPVVDAVFKDGWNVPDEPLIKKIKGNEELNYFMLFSDADNVGLDELLGYVERTIKLNIDREKKHNLLRDKVTELKELFKRNSLAKLNRLKFVFGDEELVPSLNDFDEEIIEEEIQGPTINEEITQESEVIVEQPITKEVTYLGEDGQPIKYTEEELEILEEEARAEKNRKLLANKSVVQKINKKIELPPKRKVEMVSNNSNYDSDCDCGPEEACSKCIDKKGY